VVGERVSVEGSSGGPASSAQVKKKKVCLCALLNYPLFSACSIFLYILYIFLHSRCLFAQLWEELAKDLKTDAACVGKWNGKALMTRYACAFECASVFFGQIIPPLSSPVSSAGACKADTIADAPIC
jgi:hypothetical protein